MMGSKQKAEQDPGETECRYNRKRKTKQAQSSKATGFRAYKKEMLKKKREGKEVRLKSLEKGEVIK